MRVLLVPNTGNERALAAARDLAAHLTGEGHEVLLSQGDATATGVDPLGVVATEIGAPDLAVALGGDGTILKAIHLLGPVSTRVLGANLGRLGFLCGTGGEGLPAAVDAALAGEGVVEERCTLSVRPWMGGREIGEHRALNEVFVGRAPGGRAVEVSVEIDGDEVSRPVCDGIVVATPTGSTAYALSVGGPIVAPEIRGMVVVPVAPHTLSSRPIVTGPGARVALTLPVPGRSVACLVVDGDPVPCRSPLERVEITVGDGVVRLVRLDAERFYGSARRAFFGE